ncbi:hypothetical protein [Pseudomonas sp. GL-RE-20]|uniref:hypothetical protein n=1 Tax=Pseudomonas sp. GL-RE-20 TaxID=2832372 RepID=UPI001CC109E6|nr:hypothetical protein [Pseudomonas sp. GL-RE-20]
MQPISLAASPERLTPISAYGLPEAIQQLQVSWHRVVIEVTTHHPNQPLPLSPDGFMTSALQLIPDSRQRRTHSLLDRQPQYLKATASVGTTTMREAHEVKRLRFA